MLNFYRNALYGAKTITRLDRVIAASNRARCLSDSDRITLARTYSNIRHSLTRRFDKSDSRC